MYAHKTASLFSSTLLAAVSVALAAPDAEALRKLGCKVTEKDGEIIELNAEAATFGDSEYRLIGGCPTLRKLTLNGKSLTDATLPLLAGLTELEELSTNNSQLTDDGYRHFAAFKELRSLALWHPSFGLKSFTGSGIAQLKALPELRKLTYAGATAGDDAMAAVSQLTQLREFSTWHTAQTQVGNVHLVALTNLTFLKMGQRLPSWGKPTPPSFDGSTLPVFAKIKSLETLELFEARLTAADLEPLAALPNLKLLKIHTTDISAADIDKLRAAHPALKVDHKPLTDADREATLVKKLRL